MPGPADVAEKRWLREVLEKVAAERVLRGQRPVLLCSGRGRPRPQAATRRFPSLRASLAWPGATRTAPRGALRLRRPRTKAQYSDDLE